MSEDKLGTYGHVGKLDLNVKQEETLSLNAAFLGTLGATLPQGRRRATNEVIMLGPGASVVGDFDGNGSVDFLDFFAFADAFGNPDADPVFDLDDSGSVDFLDFFAFADAFGKEGRGKLLAIARTLLDLPDQPSITTSYPNPFNSSTAIE